MIDDLRDFARLHGVTPEGFRDLEPRLPDWEKFLRARGVSEVPEMRRAHLWSEAEYQAHNLVRALFAQWLQSVHKRLKIPRDLERAFAHQAHEYRDLTDIRTTEKEDDDRPSTEPEPSDRRR
jgi:hypothetical protein